MKLSKSLLTTIIAGTTVAATASSCAKEEITKNDREHQEEPAVNENNGEAGKIDYSDCPACGMG